MPAIEPLNVLRFDDARHSELMVFLPGIGDVPEDFERNGFVQALRDSARAIRTLRVRLRPGWTGCWPSTASGSCHSTCERRGVGAP